MTEVEGLIRRLESLADYDARSGQPLGKRMREAATALANLTAERDEALEQASRFAASENTMRDDLVLCGMARDAAEHRATAAEARNAALVEGLREMIRLADMGLEDAMAEPEENGSYVAYQRARTLLSESEPHVE